MRSPPGFSAGKSTVWKLNKSLYGLKQASREWYKQVRAKLEGLGFTRSYFDHAIFYKIDEEGNRIILAVYVDDMLLVSKKLGTIVEVKGKVSKIWKMKDLGEAR